MPGGSRRFYQPAVAEGREFGARAGAEEGYAVGWEKGSEVAMEIGYYRGCVAMWLTLLEADPDRIPDKYVYASRHAG
jgi:hypothetical protein